MKKTIVLIVLLLLFSVVGALADEKDLYIDGNIQRLFTAEDGLLSTSTQAVAQTSEGFIWIGGYGGLVRYDGRNFETFAYKQITRVSDLAGDENGSLWVATSDKGLFRYEGEGFHSISGDGEDAVLDVECMAFAPGGTLYLGTYTGLGVVKDGVVRRLDVPRLNGMHIDRMLCPFDDMLLCITSSGMLYEWDGQSARLVSPESSYTLRSVCYDAASDSFLVGTSGNEVLVLDRDLNLTGRMTMNGLSCINDLYLDESGSLWLCADNGIAIYVEDSVRMQNLRMNNSVDEMMVDKEGNYWFVSSRQGVLAVSRSKFGDVSRSAGLDDMVVNAIQRIGDTLYIGHDTGMAAISATDFKKVSTRPLESLDGIRVRALLADSADNLWIGTMKQGLFRYTPGGEAIRYTHWDYPQLLSDNIRSIEETDQGMLIGTDAGAYFVGNGTVKNVLDDPKALAFRILSATKIGDTLILGSDGNGLYQVRDGQVVHHLTTEDGLSSNVIMKIYRSDAFNGLWLVTGNNLDFLGDDGTVTSIENFPSTNNLDLLIMENGDAWVFTGVGIYQTTEDSLLHDEAPKYLHFRHVDGLPYEVTPNAYHCLTGDLLYVCGSGGVFSLETDFAQTEAGDYQLVIDSVVADGQPVYIHPDEVCEIGADVQRIDINAFVLTYQTGNPFVFYRLEGFDNGKAVVQLSNMGDISYTNLNGGSYTFHFGIQDYNTGEVLQEITLPIVKHYAWHERAEVRLAAVLTGILLLALGTLLIIRIRSRVIKHRLQDEYEERERLHLQNIEYKEYLTGLYNRNYLDVWNAAPPQQKDYPITFVSIDMNNLKKINDTFGHKDGDLLLGEMAGLLKRHFSGEGYTVLRTGGDEFLILARGIDGQQVIRALEEMTADGQTVFINNIPITFAYGVCTQQNGAYDFEEGLRISDLNMLENKTLYHSQDSR